MQREPAAITALLEELELARGGHAALDREIDDLRADLARGQDMELRARALTERLAVAWQAALLLRGAPGAVAEGFAGSRLAGRWAGAYGALPAATDFDGVIARAMA